MEPISMGTSFMASAGLELLGSILQGLSYKPQTRHMTPEDKHYAIMAERFKKIRERNEAAAQFASAYTGLPVSNFSSTKGIKLMQSDSLATRNPSFAPPKTKNIYTEADPAFEESRGGKMSLGVPRMLGGKTMPEQTGATYSDLYRASNEAEAKKKADEEKKREEEESIIGRTGTTSVYDPLGREGNPMSRGG